MTPAVGSAEYWMTSQELLEEDLGRHRINLGYLAEEEYDLFEAIRLSVRLSRVETNVARIARVNERIQAELVVRELGP